MIHELLILDPIDLAASQITASSALAAFPDDALADPDPKIVFKAAASGAITITVDLQADTAWDTVFLGFTNVDGDDSWAIHRATAAAPSTWVSTLASTTLRSAGAWGQRHHGLAVLAAPVTSRYIRLTTTTTTALTAGVLLVGQRMALTWPQEYGGGRKPVERGLIQPTLGGGIARWKLGRTAAYRMTLGDLTDDELEALWRTVDEHGEMDPVLIVEQYAAASARQPKMHYGRLTGLDYYARTDAQKSRYELIIEEWR